MTSWAPAGPGRLAPWRPTCSRAPTPVIEADEVSPGAHVVTVGPKSVSAHETPTEPVEMARVVTRNSPAQARAYQEPFFTSELIDLAEVVAARVPGRQGPGEITLHCSVGLAGSEVALAAACSLLGASGDR